MAVPSRAFVGILTFALLAALAVVSYTVLALVGYQAPAQSPHELLFPADEPVATGTKVMLVLASLFCLAAVVASWRGLVGAARRDAARRQALAAMPMVEPTPAAPPVEEEPPGYH